MALFFLLLMTVENHMVGMQVNVFIHSLTDDNLVNFLFLFAITKKKKKSHGYGSPYICLLMSMYVSVRIVYDMPSNKQPSKS